MTEQEFLYESIEQDEKNQNLKKDINNFNNENKDPSIILLNSFTNFYMTKFKSFLYPIYIIIKENFF